MGMMMVASIAQQLGSQAKTKMALALTVHENSLNLQIAIPKKHVVEMVQAFQTLQKSGMTMPSGAEIPASPK